MPAIVGRSSIRIYVMILCLICVVTIGTPRCFGHIDGRQSGGYALKIYKGPEWRDSLAAPVFIISNMSMYVKKASYLFLNSGKSAIPCLNWKALTWRA